MRTRLRIPALLALLVLGGACDDPTTPADPNEAVVLFTFQGYPADTMRVLVRHRPTIEAARAYIAGRSPTNIPIGPIARGAGSDPRYPFHFIPDSVRLADLAMEVCDGEPMRTAAAVDTFFVWSTGNPHAMRATWCPWGARPIAVEPAP